MHVTAKTFFGLFFVVSLSLSLYLNWRMTAGVRVQFYAKVSRVMAPTSLSSWSVESFEPTDLGFQN